MQPIRGVDLYEPWVSNIKRHEQMTAGKVSAGGRIWEGECTMLGEY